MGVRRGWLVVAAAIALTVLAQTHTRAQEPPTDLREVRIELGAGYMLAWEYDPLSSDDLDRVTVSVAFETEDGTPVATDAFPDFDASETTLVLGEAFARVVPRGSCYRVTFSVQAHGVREPQRPAAELRDVPMCYSDDGDLFFPELGARFGPQSTAEVRAAPDGHGGVLVWWRDKSNDERGFDIRVDVVGDAGETVFASVVGHAPADATSATFPLGLLELPTGRCFDATFSVWSVFSERLATASGLPGEVTTRLCVTNTTIVFPTLGGGVQASDRGHEVVPLAVAFAGIVLVLMGSVERVRGRAA